MRFVIRNYASKPRKLTLATTITAWTTISQTGNTALIAVNIYRDPYREDGTASYVIDKLNESYHYKCAYCERIYKLDVEHYRPKAEVRDEQNQIVQVIDNAGNMINHPGYYWLCYEWSNLLPSCISCNREGGKVSKFPTMHHYEFEPLFAPPPVLDYSACHSGNNPLLTELPYLLNPEIDDPVPCFEFVIDPKKEGIRIEGLDVARRGKVTADICKLNRGEVKYDRVNKVILPIRNTLLAYVKLLSSKSSVEELIQKLYDDTKDELLDHTLLRCFIMRNRKNFEAIVIPFMTRSTKKILLEAYINYQPV
jgi:hypothetical protein